MINEKSEILQWPMAKQTLNDMPTIRRNVDQGRPSVEASVTI